jgi:hypothetical protein
MEDQELNSLFRARGKSAKARAQIERRWKGAPEVLASISLLVFVAICIVLAVWVRWMLR